MQENTHKTTTKSDGGDISLPNKQQNHNSSNKTTQDRLRTTKPQQSPANSPANPTAPTAARAPPEHQRRPRHARALGTISRGGGSNPAAGEGRERAARKMEV